MTLIKCPGCGHTVSSVASRCPQCGTLLSQFRFVQGEGGSLTECRSCSRKVLSGATTCPYCGVAHPGRRRPYAVVGLLLAFAVPALVVVALRGGGSEALSPVPSASVEPQLPRAVGAAAPEPAGQVETLSAVRQAPAEEPAPKAVPDAEAVPTQTRWTLDWANVREGRALGTRVVRVLRPGSTVQVTDRQAGWWALYADGQVVGYVAGSVLGDRPPSEPQPEPLRLP